MTARWISVDALWAGDARDLAAHALNHSWDVVALQEGEWLADETLIDETLRIRIRPEVNGCVHQIYAFYDQVNRDGGHVASGWKFRTLDSRDRVLYEMPAVNNDQRALWKLIVDLGWIELRDEVA